MTNYLSKLRDAASAEMSKYGPYVRGTPEEYAFIALYDPETCKLICDVLDLLQPGINPNSKLGEAVEALKSHVEHK